MDRINDFVEVTGDDSDRWAEAAPPGFAAAALFVVAPDLLGRLTDHSVIHGEQTFIWHEPIQIGSLLDVEGTVTRSRERGGVHFVGFDLAAVSHGRPVVEGSSLFVVSGEAIPGRAEFERPEPSHAHRGAPGPGQESASRADLVRYAAATRDWNPIHWDHEAAVAAGMPGVVVHGLLQSSWAFKAVAHHVGGLRPLISARVRFRNPLPPARPVEIGMERDGQTFAVVVSDDTATYLTTQIEVDHE